MRGEGEKMDKIGSVRYKCPYTACQLEYQSSLGYKRHLMYYKHALFTPSGKKIMCGHVDCKETENLKEHIKKCHAADAEELLETYEVMSKTSEETEETSAAQMEHDIVHDEGLLDISRVLEEKDIIQDIIMATFPKGVTYIINFDSFSDQNQAFFCRIPGCGRQFKSLMAYKYHCGKFTHLFKSMVDKYIQTHGGLDYTEIRDLFKKKFNLENRFLLEGVSHHLMRMPDQYYNFIFTFDVTQIGHEKRRVKKKAPDSISEFGIGAEEGEEKREEETKKAREEEEEEKVSFKVDSIILNGRKMPHLRHYKQGRLSFFNVKMEITCMAGMDDLVIVGARGDLDAQEGVLHENMKAHNIFSFSGGNAAFFVIDGLRIASEITIEGFGFPRKIMHVAPQTVLCLFNDGSLREISFTKEHKLAAIRKVETKGPSIDFVVFKNMVITCNHRLLCNITTRKERPFNSPIISMGTTEQVIIVVDSNGKTYMLTPSFDDAGIVPSKVGTNVAIGLGTVHNLIFISNSLYGLGRIYSTKSNTTLLVSPHASSNAILIRPGFIISSGLDGTVCVSGYDTEPKVYMRVIKTEIRGEDLYITTSEEEHALGDNAPPSPSQDYRTCIQGIVSLRGSLVVALTCGVVISVSDFFKQPPLVLSTTHVDNE